MPSVFIDGVRVYNYYYNGIKPYIEQRKSVDRPMTIDLTAVYNAQDDEIEVTANVTLEEDISDGNWRLYLFVTENNLGGHNFVERDMDNTSLTIRNAGEEQEHYWSFNPSSSWDVDDMMAGAFVQKLDGSSYNVYQAVMVDHLEESLIENSSLGQIRALLK